MKSSNVGDRLSIQRVYLEIRSVPLKLTRGGDVPQSRANTECTQSSFAAYALARPSTPSVLVGFNRLSNAV